MRHILGYDAVLERLRVANEVRDLLATLDAIHGDKVARLLMGHLAESRWPDDQDLNMFTVGGQGGGEIRFLPKARRPPGDPSGWEWDKSQAIKPGRMAEAILSRAYPQLGPVAAKGEFRSGGVGRTWADKADYTLVVPLDSLPEGLPDWLPTFALMSRQRPRPWSGLPTRDLEDTNVMPLTMRVEAGNHKFAAKVTGVRVAPFVCHLGGPSRAEGREMECLVIEYQTDYERLVPDKKMAWLDFWGPTEESRECELTDIKLALLAFDGRDIELFSSRMSSLMSKGLSKYPVEEVRGEEIRKCYDKDNTRAKADGEPAFTSCMSDPEKLGYMDLYCENPGQVSLLVMRDEAGRLLGRALVWKLSSHPAGKTHFIDRVYAAHPVLEQTFFAYARQRGWATDPDDPMEVRLDKWDFRRWPFVDTMCYLDGRTGALLNPKMYADRQNDLATEGRFWLLRAQDGNREPAWKSS